MTSVSDSFVVPPLGGIRFLADANKYKTWTAARLAKALEQLDWQIVEDLKTLEANDTLDQDLLGEDVSADRFPSAIQDLKARREQLSGLMQTASEQRRRVRTLIGPLAEPRCADNPAIREDLTQPVAPERIKDLPINPQTKRFDKPAFVYDEATDCYYCPAGKALPHRTTENTTHRGGKPVQREVYTCHDCAGCPLATLCRKNPDSKGSQSTRQGREVMHDKHEGARRRQRERMKTPEAEAAYARRQHIGELPFTVIKTMFDMRRFLLRG